MAMVVLNITTELTKVWANKYYKKYFHTVANDGFTPLMWAAKNGHVEVMKLLLQQSKIDVNEEVGYSKIE